MENTNKIIKIRKTRGYTPLFLILGIILLGFSVYCVCYAYTSQMTGTPLILFYAAGGIGTMFFTYSTFDNLFQTVSPKNALIIGNESMADFTVADIGVGEIRWDNIKNIQRMPSKKCDILVLELHDLESVTENAPSAVQKAILRSDWGENSIAISQADIEMKLSELESLIHQRIGRFKENVENSSDNGKTKVMTDDQFKSLRPVEAKPDVKEEEKPEADYRSELAKIFAEDEAPEKSEEESATAESATYQANETGTPEITEAKAEVKTKENNSLSNVEDLLSDFSAKLKNGGKALNESERNELTEQLNALLENLNKKEK